MNALEDGTGTMNTKILSRQKNKVSAVVTINIHRSNVEREEIIIGKVGVYLKLYASDYDCFGLHVMLENLSKKDDDTIYACKFTSAKLDMVEQRFICDDSQWRIIMDQTTHHDVSTDFVCDLMIEVETIEKKSPFAVLYDDTELTDFELCAEDGSVKFHSAVLAAASPALRRMLAGKWAETENRTLQTEGSSKATLQHLKDYLYLSVLPDTGLEHLLSLSNYYLMTDLEYKCIDKLLSNVTVESSTELMKFALSHGLMKLYYAFLKLVQDGGVNITENAMQE